MPTAAAEHCAPVGHTDAPEDNTTASAVGPLHRKGQEQEISRFYGPAVFTVRPSTSELAPTIGDKATLSQRVTRGKGERLHRGFCPMQRTKWRDPRAGEGGVRPPWLF